MEQTSTQDLPIVNWKLPTAQVAHKWKLILSTVNVINFVPLGITSLMIGKILIIHPFYDN